MFLEPSGSFGFHGSRPSYGRGRSVKSAREMLFPLQTLEMPASIASWVGSKAARGVFKLMTADAGCYRRQQEAPSTLRRLWLAQQGHCKHPKEQKSKTTMSEGITGRWGRCRAHAHRKKQKHLFFFNVIYQVSRNWLMASDKTKPSFAAIRRHLGTLFPDTES